MIELECSWCKQKFERPYKQWKYQVKVSGNNYKPFCNNICQGHFKTNEQCILFNCEQCGKQSSKTPSNYNKAKHHFCDKSCSIIWQNTNTDRSFIYKTKNTICVDYGMEYGIINK